MITESGTPKNAGPAILSLSDEGPPVRWRSLWKIAFVLATILGSSTTLLVYFGMLFNRKPLPFRTAMLASLPDWYFWALLTPVVFWLGVRFPFDRRGWPRAASLHLAAGITVAIGELALFTSFNHWFYYNPWSPAPADFSDHYIVNVQRYFHLAFLIYWLIVAAAHAAAYYRRSQRRELEASRLAAINADLASRLSHAQLDILRAQLQPHFLFNTLNTISGFVRDNRGAEATELVARLGRLLRQSLDGRFDRNEVPLRDELAFADAYLDIERTRFRDRLEIRFDVAPEAMDVEVPSMLLQPLLENAIRHGVQGTGGGLVEVRARCETGSLTLEVRDNGAGLRSDRPDGVGLGNTRARLERLYGPGCELAVTNASEGGAVVSVRIPRGARAS